MTMCNGDAWLIHPPCNKTPKQLIEGGKRKSREKCHTTAAREEVLDRQAACNITSSSVGKTPNCEAGSSSRIFSPYDSVVCRLPTRVVSISTFLVLYRAVRIGELCGVEHTLSVPRDLNGHPGFSGIVNNRKWPTCFSCGRDEKLCNGILSCGKLYITKSARWLVAGVVTVFFCLLQIRIMGLPSSMDNKLYCILDH